MTDIVKRLRTQPFGRINVEAADEIERLREAIRLALRCTPFIAVDDDGVPSIRHDCGDPWDILIKALENKP